MSSYLTRIVLIGCLQIILSMGAASAAEDKIAEIIRSKVEQITSKGELQIEGAQIASATVLPDVYEENGFRRLWTNPKNVDDLYNAVTTIDEDGLRPDDYHYTILNQLRSRADSGTSSDPELFADIDILLTDSLIRLGYHLIIGKVDPLDHHPQWNLAVEIDDDEPVKFIQETLEAGSLAKEIKEFRPPNIIYSEYKTALKKYRTIKDNGGWQQIPEGPTLKKGMLDNRVLLLRQRLKITGDLEEKASESEHFDEALEQAVIRFQNRHHITPDGAVGKGTLAALNVPVEDRIDQIRINIERSRWVLHEIRGKFVIADIAGFNIYVYKDNAVLWTSRVQVGKPYRETPMFKSEIKYLEFNPTWTIPPGILAKDILPAVKKDPYKRDAEVLEGLNGEFKFRKRPVGQKRQTL